MIIKNIFFIILLIFYFNCYASLGAGIAIGMEASSGSNNDNGDIFISKKFDYIIACSLKYRLIDEDCYEYSCKDFDIPRHDKVLFMSTTFYNDGWPHRLIYYMKRK